MKTYLVEGANTFLFTKKYDSYQKDQYNLVTLCDIIMQTKSYPQIIIQALDIIPKVVYSIYVLMTRRATARHIRITRSYHSPVIPPLVWAARGEYTPNKNHLCIIITNNKK